MEETAKPDNLTYTLSTDRMTLVIKRRTGAGILISTFDRDKQAGPFADADVESALSALPAASRTMQPGQRNRTSRTVTRFGTLYGHLMLGPPTWWLPKLRRQHDGTIMIGWLRLAVAIHLDRSFRAA
jgi:hypothetical protein